LKQVGADDSEAAIDFEVVETGHFQNFRWVHVGAVELGAEADYELRINPKEIRNAALMDIRAVHLIRLPD